MPAPVSIFHNFWLKLFSVLLAIVIWTAVHFSIKNEVSIGRLNINRVPVPVSIIAPPGPLHEYKLSPPEVVILAIGDAEALRRGIHASVDLSNFHGPGTVTQEIRIEAPPEINIIETNPLTILVEQLP